MTTTTRATITIDVTDDLASLSEEDRQELLSTVAASTSRARLTVRGYAFDGFVSVDQLDTSSSASRQHYIDTGRYLPVGETEEV